MTTITELERLLDALDSADNPNAQFAAMVALCDALFTLERDAAPALRALIDAVKAAHGFCHGDLLGEDLVAALAPLFPDKEAPND